MKLNRRYLRSIRENLSFYLSSTVLTMLTLLLFFLFSTAGNAILDFSEDFYAAHLREDAHFSTYLPISQEALEELEEDYGITLEAQSYVNLETDGTTARVFSATEKVDTYEVTQGRDVERSGDIIISEGYALNMDVALGDTVTVGEKDYTVVGYFQRPDYLYMLEDESDSYKNITSFFLAYLSEDDFEALGETSVQYLARYPEGTDVEGFRKEVYEDYYIRSYSSAQENPRICMVEQQAELFLVMSYILLCILPLIAVALICIIISRKVKSEQRMIGTLAALGYSRGQLMRHYAGFAAIPGLLGGVLTAVISVLAAQPYSELGLQDYEPMRVEGRVEPLNIALGILLPTVMYILAALLAVRRLLKQDTVLLLSGSGDNGRKKRRRLLANSAVSFRVKFALRSLLGNPARSFVVLLGIFMGCFFSLFSFGMVDTLNHMKTTAADTMGSFEHQYVLNELLEENPYGGEPLLVSAFESEEGYQITLIGADPDNPYLSLTDEESGESVTLNDDCYISSLTAYALGWETGDTVTLYNPLSLEESEVTIAGVVHNNVQKAIYTSRSSAAELTELDADSFNALVSAEALDIPDSKVMQESRRSDISDQVQTMLDQMGGLIYTLVVFGIIICVAAIYVAVNMLVTENRNTISMLKVLGYPNRKISRIVLSIHHVLLPIGVLLGIPAAYGLCGMFFQLMVNYGLLLMDAWFSPRSYVLSIGLTFLSYFGSLWLVKRKVNRVDMIECLKDTRE